MRYRLNVLSMEIGKPKPGIQVTANKIIIISFATLPLRSGLCERVIDGSFDYPSYWTNAGGKWQQVAGACQHVFGCLFCYFCVTLFAYPHGGEIPLVYEQPDWRSVFIYLLKKTKGRTGNVLLSLNNVSFGYRENHLVFEISALMSSREFFVLLSQWLRKVHLIDCI